MSESLKLDDFILLVLVMVFLTVIILTFIQDCKEEIINELRKDKK